MTRKRILELTVVPAVLAIAIFGSLGVVFPPMIGCRLNANETAAIATLRNLASAQGQFQTAGVVDIDRDGRAEYGTFRELSAGGYLRGDHLLGRLDPPVLSGAFNAPGSQGEIERSGYRFRIFLPGKQDSPVCADRAGPFYNRICADGAERHWCAYAWPIQITEKQRRVFFVNEGGVIFGSKLESALGKAGPPPGSGLLADDGQPSRDQPDQHGRTWLEVK